MKIFFAAVAFIFMAAAADARHTAPQNTNVYLLTETIDKGLGKNLLTLNNEPANNTPAGTTAGNQPDLSVNLTVKVNQQKPDAMEDAIPPQEQNPAQNPATKETGTDQAQRPQEVKAIPKARRVEKPAKIEGGSAKRPSLGSAKRGNASSARPNATSAKPDRPDNPGQVNRAARASRPTGGGRPNNAGRPNKGKGKD